MPLQRADFGGVLGNCLVWLAVKPALLLTMNDKSVKMGMSVILVELST